MASTHEQETVPLNAHIESRELDISLAEQCWNFLIDHVERYIENETEVWEGYLKFGDAYHVDFFPIQSMNSAFEGLDVERYLILCAISAVLSQTDEKSSVCACFDDDTLEWMGVFAFIAIY